MPGGTGDKFYENLNFSNILHGHNLEVVSCARYLGTDISNDLSWNSHIDRITSKANSTLGFFGTLEVY